MDPTVVLRCLLLIAMLSVCVIYYIVLHLISDLRVWFESVVLVEQKLKHLTIGIRKPDHIEKDIMDL